MSDVDRVHIVGVGDEGLNGLTAAARQLIENAELLIGDREILARVPEGDAERFVVDGLDQVVERMQAAAGQRVVVLAEGDPLFYGVARFLCDKLGKERFEVVPHVSSMQLAFARVKESWEDALLTNLANRDLARVVEQTRTAEKVGLFTTDATPPSAVAKALLERGIDYFTAYVCENLNSPDERVTQGELSEVVDQQFSPMNVMILVRKPGAADRPADTVGRRLFGNADDTFLQTQPKRALVTPAEIRVMALAEMDLGPASVVWDVGAGSGSVAIEAAQIAREGMVYAIEQAVEDHALISQNAERFGVKNLVAVLGRAPEAWEDLPQPDAVFVGGSGRQISRLVEAAFQRLRPGGRLVATMGSLDNIAETHQMLQSCSPEVNVWMVNLARGRYQMDRLRFESLNPTFLIGAVKSQ